MHPTATVVASAGALRRGSRPANPRRSSGPSSSRSRCKARCLLVERVPALRCNAQPLLRECSTMGAVRWPSAKRTSVGVGFAALVWLAPSGARAEGATLVARYTAPAGCPDGSAFVREVAARTTKVVVALSPDRDETTVAIEKDAEGFVGKLTVAGAAPRVVHASTCEETTAALSFVLALAYDPDAVASPAAPPPETPAVAPVAPRAPSQSAPRAASPLAPPTPALERELVVGGLVEIGSLAGPSVGARLFFGVAWSGRVLAPALRVSVGRTLPSTETGEGGRRALLTFTDVELEACGLAFGGNTARLRVRVRVCGLGLVGAVESDGRTAVPRSDVNAWAAVGLSAPFTLALGRAIALEIRPVVGRTLVFDRFFAEPNFTVYEAPVLYAKVGAGIDFRFP